MDEILKKVFVEMPVEHSKLKLAPTEIEVSNEKALLLRVFCEFVQEKAERENVLISHRIFSKFELLMLFLCSAYGTPQMCWMRSCLSLLIRAY